MAYLIKFTILLCAAAAASAASIHLNDFNLEQVLLHDQLEMFESDRRTEIIGTCNPTDRRLHKETVEIPAAANQVRSRRVYYRPELSPKSRVTVNCIKVTDLLKTGKNGFFAIVNGGIGQDSVIIEFKSQRGGVAKFFVEIYGYFSKATTK